jgi:hypothetical protein
MNNLQFIIILRFAPILLSGILLFTGCQQKQSGEMVAHPPAEVTFDGNRAYTFLERQCAFGPRYPASPGHAQALEWISQELSKRTNSFLRQTFDYTPKWGPKVTMTNLIVSFAPGRNDRILLCAHWDTRPWADQDPNPTNRSRPILGANDGASGVAILLEITEVFMAKPPPVGVDLVFFDGEDYGRSEDGLDDYFAGSRYFARHLILPDIPKYAILLDMVGDADLDIYIERNSYRYARDIIDRVWSTAGAMGLDVFHHELLHTVFDDHIPLNQVGIPAIDIIDFDYPYWHTLEDTPDKCRPESLKTVGDLLLRVIYTE